MPNKVCPKCAASKHVRVSMCDCGYQFYAKKGEVKSEIEVKQSVPSETTKSSTSFLSLLTPKQNDEQIIEKSISIISSGIDNSKPGPGKKQCANCLKYIGVRSEVCSLCGFNFKTKEKINIDLIRKKDDSKSFDGPGKGRKECPKCKTFLGARSTICKCGHNFESKIEKTKKDFFFVEERPKTFIDLIADSKSKKEKEDLKQKQKEQGLVKFQTEGQGRKLCPTCFDNGDRLCYVPVATRSCDCGYFFEKKKKSKPLTKQDQIVLVGNFLSYNQENPLVNHVLLNLEFNTREYQIMIKKSLNAEEVDAELSHLDQIQGLSTINPNEIVGYLTKLFRIENNLISWNWVLPEEQFQVENKLPSYLRYSLYNRRLNNTSELWKAFKIARNEYIKKNLVKEEYNFVNLNCPNYHKEGSRTVLAR